MNDDRLLALAVMDSIEHMTGHAPRRVTYWPLIAWLVVAFVVAISVVFAA